MLELALRHFLGIVIIVYHVIFVSRCDRANCAFEKVHESVGPVNEENAPYFGADVLIHAIKLSSFIGRLRLLLAFLQFFPGIQNDLGVGELRAHGISRRVHMKYRGDVTRDGGVCVRISMHVWSDKSQKIGETEEKREIARRC